MSASRIQPWWKNPRSRAQLKSARPGSAPEPELLPSTKLAIQGETLPLIPAFTPEWTNRGAGDAGVAFTKLYSELSSPVRARANQLPQKMFGEYLRAGGIEPLGPSPASAMLTFELSSSATEPVAIPQGFQIGAPSAAGQGLVVFETATSFVAAPLRLTDFFLKNRSIFSVVDTTSQPWYPLGKQPKMGHALYLGMEGPPADLSTLTLGVDIAEAPGEPPPASAGGLSPLPVEPPPVLAWEVSAGGSFEPCEVLRDETAGLGRSGIVEIRVQRSWKPSVIDALQPEPRFWLRLRLVFGRFAAAPRLLAIRLNVARATATRTIRNEILKAVPTLNRERPKMQLSQKPVLPGSIVLEIDESGGLDTSGQDGTSETPYKRWNEVSDLQQYDSEAQVFTLDAEKGILTFGDGVHGRQLPPGFRHVRAVRYQVGSGSEGAVAEDKIKQLLSSARFLTGVTNPRAASGGLDAEPREAALRRGPLELRARSRAVTLTDYELMAQQAPGSSIARSHAVSSLHPAFPGSKIPGLVGVFLVPPDAGEGAPIADQDTLANVARYLAKNVAPAGVEVVTAAVKFHRVRLEASVIVHPDFEIASVIRDIIDAANAFLHPITGGADGQGWPFGGALRYRAILQRLVEVPGVSSIPRLNMVIDARRTERCADYLTPPHELLWPTSHEIIPVEAEA